MQTSLAFVLRRNPFRDNSLLLDLLTEDEGRVTAVIRLPKKQGTRIKGMLEPFRLLELGWTGRGEVFTLVQAEEKGRYRIQQDALLQALYVNEVLLRVFQPMQPIPELFQHYREVLHRLQAGADRLTVLRFELDVLATCGHELNLWQDDATGQDIDAQMRYRFRFGQGILPVDTDTPEVNDTVVSGALLVALRDPQALPPVCQQELRQVLDRLLRLLLPGKTLYARQLLSE